MLYQFDKNCLEFKRLSIKKILISIIFVLALSTIMSFVMATKLYKTIIISEEAKMVVLKEQNEFTRDKLKEYILQLNIKFPYIVLAQAELESGHFKSPMFKENNNMFGMKEATKRPTTNKGTNRGHAYFNTWRDCVVDYAFYSASYLNNIKSEREYLDYLKQNYAEDPNYIDKLKIIIKKNKEN